ncbi:MAG TPA: hypothetical protein VFC39_21885 [Acidobacteriaceae bacterium]|nr:hypothetical protein [Acidobacteriaceae bacterium]
MTAREKQKAARAEKLDEMMARIAAERAWAWARSPAGTKYDCSDLRRAAWRRIKEAR